MKPLKKDDASSAGDLPDGENPKPSGNSASADRLCECSAGPDSLYRLPFGSETGWTLVKGNWDDPNNSHDPVDGHAQSYSYDFSYKGQEGHPVRAARGGWIELVRSTQSANTKDKVPDPPGSRGEGNIVVIRHLDGTVSAYAHLQKDKVFVQENEYVPRGRILGLCGNTGHSDGPHLHFDVHPDFTDMDHWLPTMKIRFEDAQHSCWRPNVGDTLKSNNIVSSTPMVALLGPGTGLQSFLAGMEFDDFVAAWIHMGPSSSTRKKDAPILDMTGFDTYVENGKRRFAGLFGPGKGGQHFVAGMEFQPFEDFRLKVGKESPKKDLLAFDTYVENGKRRFAGLFGPGKGGQQFVPGMEFQPFEDFRLKVGKESPEKDLLAFRVYREGGKTLFAGLFGPGKGGQQFVAGMEFQPFVELWVKLGKPSQKKDMYAVQAYEEGGKTLFAGLFGPGAGGQQFFAGIQFDELAAEWQKGKQEGRRLLAITVGKPG